MLEILSPDLTPLEDVVVPNLEAGADSGVVPFAIRNSTGEDIRDALLVVQVEHPTIANRWVASGFAPVDELWPRVRLTGQDTTAAPLQQPYVTPWTPIGAYAALVIPEVLAGGIRLGELKIRPPSSAGPLAWRWMLATIEAEHSRPVPGPLTAAMRGVLTGVGDLSRSGLVRGGEVAVSSPADDEIHVAAAVWLHRGRVQAKVTTNHELNQADGAAAALAAGQAYWAVVSLGEGVSVTKGLKGVAPAKPAWPAGETFLRWVYVAHDAGGASVIDAADLSGETPYDRYLAVPEGLGLRVHQGQALGGSTWRYWSSSQLVGLADATTTWLWQVANGLLEVTTTPEPPDTTALPLWEAVTAGGVVTELHDRRTYFGETVVLTLRGPVPGAPGFVDELVVEHDELHLERVVGRVSDPGAGSSGETVLDVLADGDTLYTSHATDDQRPTFAFDAAGDELVHREGVPEITLIRRGTVLRLITAEHPTGGAAPARAEVALVCRRS